MPNPPLDQYILRSGETNSAADQLNRIADAIKAYTDQRDAAKAKNSKHNRKIHKWGRVTTIGALVYTLITAFIFIATIRSIQEAGRAADAATAQAKTAADTEKRQLRAYVFVDKASVTLDGRTLKGIVDLKNAGQTPAYELITRSRIETDEAGKPFTPKPLDNVAPSRGILGPAMVGNPQAELTLPPENTAVLAALQNGRAVIYMIAQTQYRDAFDRTWILDFRLRSHHYDGSRWIMEPPEDGNTETQKE
jgi:hypothetical protein